MSVRKSRPSQRDKRRHARKKRNQRQPSPAKPPISPRLARRYTRRRILRAFRDAPAITSIRRTPSAFTRANLPEAPTCLDCSQPPAWRRTRCATCLRKSRDSQRRRIAKRRRQAVCIRCAEPVAPGHRHCGDHLIAEREYQRLYKRRVRAEQRANRPPKTRALSRAERVALGLCRQCGSPNVVKMHLCQQHLDDQRRYGREHYRRKRAAANHDAVRAKPARG